MLLQANSSTPSVYAAHFILFLCLFITIDSYTHTHTRKAKEIEVRGLSVRLYWIVPVFHSNRIPLDLFLTLSHLFNHSHTHTLGSLWLLLFYDCCCRSNFLRAFVFVFIGIVLCTLLLLVTIAIHRNAQSNVTKLKETIPIACFIFRSVPERLRYRHS